jgi:hypothetical protein
MPNRSIQAKFERSQRERAAYAKDQNARVINPLEVTSKKSLQHMCADAHLNTAVRAARIARLRSHFE